MFFTPSVTLSLLSDSFIHSIPYIVTYFHVFLSMTPPLYIDTDMNLGYFSNSYYEYYCTKHGMQLSHSKVSTDIDFYTGKFWKADTFSPLKIYLICTVSRSWRRIFLVCKWQQAFQTDLFSDQKKVFIITSIFKVNVLWEDKKETGFGKKSMWLRKVRPSYLDEYKWLLSSWACIT